MNSSIIVMDMNIISVYIFECGTEIAAIWESFQFYSFKNRCCSCIIKSVKKL